MKAAELYALPDAVFVVGLRKAFGASGEKPAKAKKPSKKPKQASRVTVNPVAPPLRVPVAFQESTRPTRVLWREVRGAVEWLLIGSNCTIGLAPAVAVTHGLTEIVGHSSKLRTIRSRMYDGDWRTWIPARGKWFEFVIY